MFLRVSRVGVVAVQPPQATLPLATRSDRGSSGGRADWPQTASSGELADGPLMSAFEPLRTFPVRLPLLTVADLRH